MYKALHKRKEGCNIFVIPCAPSKGRNDILQEKEGGNSVKEHKNINSKLGSRVSDDV
jgi:hypothetical protein